MHAMIEIVLLIAIVIIEMTCLNRAIQKCSIALPSVMRGIAEIMITKCHHFVAKGATFTRFARPKVVIAAAKVALHRLSMPIAQNAVSPPAHGLLRARSIPSGRDLQHSFDRSRDHGLPA
eukprot:506726-Rhodomonas_salina.1